MVRISSTVSNQVLRPTTRMEAFGNAVRLRALPMRGAMRDRLELEEEFVRMPVFAAAEFAAVVGKNRFDFRAVRLERRDDAAT